MQITEEEFEKLKEKVGKIEEIINIIFDRDIEEGRIISLEDYEEKYTKNKQQTQL